MKFGDVEFLSLLPHEGVLAVDLLHHSNSHVALIMAWQIEVISSGFSFTFPQQIGMLGDISLVLFEALLHCLVAASNIDTILALDADQTINNIPGATVSCNINVNLVIIHR